MSAADLVTIARAMVAPGKGILAADESTGTIAKRFQSINVENVEENRRAYRDMLLTTPGLGDYISGAILFDETLRQKTKDGKPFTQLMMENGILPGIKVDKGTVPLAGFPGEVVTEGLDGLRDRLKEYAALGAKFAKWRAVINIGEDMPSKTCIDANMHALARYAALCQEAGIEGLRIHDLRHSFASYALSAGHTLGVVGQLLGHRSTQTTSRYAHLITETAQAAVARVSDDLGV